MRLEDAITDYMGWARVEKGYSQTGNKQRQYWLGELLKWMQENGYRDPAVEDLTTPALRRFQFYLNAGGLRPRTIHNAIYPIKSLSAYLIKSGALSDNPASALTLPKLDEASREEVTDAEMMQLMEDAARIHPPRRAALASAIIYTVATTGIRRGELIALRLGDVNLEDGSLILRHTKNGKSHRVYLPDTALLRCRFISSDSIQVLCVLRE